MVAKDSVQREGEIRSRLFHQNLKKQNIAMLLKRLKSTEKDGKCTNSFFKIKIADINLEKTSSYEHAHTYTYREKTNKDTKHLLKEYHPVTYHSLCLFFP